MLTPTPVRPKTMGQAWMNPRKPHRTMYEHNQIDVPPSFMALYCRNGRPVEARGVIETRYDVCEDLALGVANWCKDLSFKDDLPEETVLQRCHAGLLASPDTLSAPEAGWVVSRAAELLSWPIPQLPQPEEGDRGDG